MSQVGVRELRENLSGYLERVKQGETFYITQHGKPVAVITHAAHPASLVDRLEQEGKVARRGHGDLDRLGPPLVLPTGAPTLSPDLEETRAERM